MVKLNRNVFFFIITVKDQMHLVYIVLKVRTVKCSWDKLNVYARVDLIKGFSRC